MKPTMRDARAYAAGAFAAARKAYGDQPYTVHLDAVVAVLEAAGFGDGTCQIGYLHDILEDTEVNTADLWWFGFDEHTIAAVLLVTDPAGVSRKARKLAAYDRVRAAKELGQPAIGQALVVKWADRIANVEACVKDGRTGLLKMYMREDDDFVDVYTPTDPIHLDDWRFRKLQERYERAKEAARAIL